VLQAQDEERRRIARELHDTAGQTLTVLGLNLAQLLEKAKHRDPELAELTRASEEIVGQLHREIRTTSYLLHPPLLDESGLASSLDWYVQGLSGRSTLAIHLRIAPDFGRIPRDMELVVFRLIQECLTNIHRHANAQNAFIRVTRINGNVSVEVEDDGQGMSPEKLAEVQSAGSGVGICGMRERIHQFQGDMKIESDSSGTKMLVTIPVVGPSKNMSTAGRQETAA
jgi:two-component system, NarL family, sensor kinase